MAFKHRFKLSSVVSESDKYDQALKDYYKNWRVFNQKSGSPFIAIDTSFQKKYLKELEPGPLKLYLYFCFAANNEFGHSWHGIQRIAEYFDAQTRTIDNWIRVLVDKDLIYRAQKGQKSHTTYLLPFGDTVIMHPTPKKREEDNQNLLEDLLIKINELSFIYGEIIKVFHLFQWSNLKEKPGEEHGNQQYLLIITKRNNDVLIGHLHVLRKSTHLGVNLLEIEEPAIFTSPFIYKDHNVIGIALPSIPRLSSKSAMQDLLNLIREVTDLEGWIIEDRQKIMYGDKAEMLTNIEEVGEHSEEETEENSDEEHDEESEEVPEKKTPRRRLKKQKK